MPRQDMHISPVARSGQHNRLIQGRLTDMNGVVHKGDATPVTDVYGYSCDFIPRLFQPSVSFIVKSIENMDNLEPFR